jgi:hypothetical protein
MRRIGPGLFHRVFRKSSRGDDEGAQLNGWSDFANGSTSAQRTASGVPLALQVLSHS